MDQLDAITTYPGVRCEREAYSKIIYRELQKQGAHDLGGGSKLRHFLKHLLRSGQNLKMGRRGSDENLVGKNAEYL